MGVLAGFGRGNKHVQYYQYKDLLKMSTEQPKSHRAGLPAPVSMKDRDAAIADLRSSRWLDVDAFLSDIKPERLLHSRLGPSGDCLTVDDLSRLDLVGSVCCLLPRGTEAADQ